MPFQVTKQSASTHFDAMLLRQIYGDFPEASAEVPEFLDLFSESRKLSPSSFPSLFGKKIK
ncbi:hypothetical protein [Paraburkholderia unamae]|uniref:hypothetical protein n=1 Tax=Paraburkholderia unamae TaxID=219649 RepID=UPI000DD33BE3|nr:hypothetical protein [Paraburkholderia unamae]